MVSAGLEYGYVCTGEAYVFLQVPEDPTTVHYYLSVPNRDVGERTGWSDDAASSTSNCLHLTAMGQVLAFALQAFQSRPRSQHWRAKAQESLKTWEFSFEEISDRAPGNDKTPSHDCPIPNNELFRVSSVSVRQNLALQDQTRFGTVSPDHTKDDESNLGNINLERTSRKSPAPTRDSPESQRNYEQRHQGTKLSDAEREKQRTRAFCTPNCLLGLVNGGELDSGCPNVDEHGTSVHRIDKPAFLALMHQQLSRTLDSNFEPCFIETSSLAIFSGNAIAVE